MARANSALGLLISVLGGLAAGEWMLLDAMSRNSPQVPLLAVLCFGFAAGSLALYRGVGIAADPPARALMGQRARRVIALLAAAGLTAYVLQQLQILPGDASHVHVIAAWLLAFALYTAAVLPRRDAATRTWVRWRALWAEQRWVALAAAGILLVALFVRVWQLGSIPFVFSGDEASFGKEALRTMSGAISDPFTTGWLSQPTASFFYNSLGIYALGPTVEAARLPWALVGAATVPVVFWLVSRLAGVSLGLVTAALLAVYHFHLHYSRLTLNNIADPLFVALALLALYCALDKKSTAYWVMLGGVCGLALYFYQGARITPLIVGLVLGYLLLYGRGPFWREHRRGTAVALGAFLVSAAPMIQYAIRFPADFNARINMVSILHPGWLEADAAARGMTVPGVLLDQFQRAALAFNYFPDRAPFYGLPQPLLDPLFGAVFLLGLGYGTFRVFGKYPDKRLFPMVAWWWSGIILGGMLTESPPSSQRIVTVTVPVCFFVALGLYKLIEVVRSAALLKGQGTVVMAAGVVLFAGISLKTYFVDFTPQWIAGGVHAEIATEILPVLRQIGPGYDAYFAGAPAMFWDFPTLHYPGDPMPGKDIVEPLTAPPRSNMVPPGRGAVFVFLPHRLTELGFVRAAFPNGTVREVYSPARRQVIVTLYSIPPSESATP